MVLINAVCIYSALIKYHAFYLDVTLICSISGIYGVLG